MCVCIYVKIKVISCYKMYSTISQTPSSLVQLHRPSLTVLYHIVYREPCIVIRIAASSLILSPSSDGFVASRY